MKTLYALPLIAILGLGCVPPQEASPRPAPRRPERVPSRPAPPRAASLPATGVYYIVNNGTGQALEPNAPSLGQNVFMVSFKRSGVQKWKVTRKVDPRTNQATNRCTIRLAGENRELNLEPHPSVSDRCPILGLDVAVFSLALEGDGVVIKSVSHGGDALYPYSQEGDQGEPRFARNDGSPSFRWTFIPAEED